LRAAAEARLLINENVRNCRPRALAPPRRRAAVPAISRQHAAD